MHMLVINDDGINAPRLLALNRALSTVADTTVFAPSHNWSASGHVKTMHKPLRVSETHLADGTPALTASEMTAAPGPTLDPPTVPQRCPAPVGPRAGVGGVRHDAQVADAYAAEHPGAGHFHRHADARAPEDPGAGHLHTRAPRHPDAGAHADPRATAHLAGAKERDLPQ
jgi:hypothetical protein